MFCILIILLNDLAINMALRNKLLRLDQYFQYNSFPSSLLIKPLATGKQYGG